MKAVLERFWKQFAKDFTLVCEEWDICRGAEFDLLDEANQVRLLQRIQSGEFMAVLLSPPCASWSRAPWANPWGPRPLRTVLYPWGLPWLEGPKLLKVAQSNNMVRLCILIIQTVQLLPQVAFLLEHPENLGSIRSRPSATVRPASIWELPEVQALLQPPAFTVAFYQCKFGAKSRKPTRLLTDLQHLRFFGHQQWPQLNNRGCYTGPLPIHCSCGHSHTGIIKRSAEDAFSTSQAAAYPEQMDLKIAIALWKHATSSSCSFPFGGEVTHNEKEEKENKEREEADEKERKQEDLGKPQKEEVERLIRAAEKGAQRLREERDVRAPLRVHYKGRVRRFCDGLGNCSPGIRPAGHRLEERRGKGKRLFELFWSEVVAVVDSWSKQERLRIISMLALGRFETSPFQDRVEEIKKRMDEEVQKLGKDPGRKPGDRTSSINFRRLKAWAEITEDEDCRFLEGLVSKGVPLGVRGEIPMVAEVYDKKVKGDGEDGIPPFWQDGEDVHHRDNYGTAVAHMDKVKTIVLDEERKGWVRRMQRTEAEKRYGPEMQVASVGAVPKDPSWDEIRVVHDGTHGIQVNSQIKQPNKMPFPQCDDVEVAAIALQEERPRERMMFAFDIKAAHRLIPVQEEDWGLQSFRLDDKEEIWLNMVGTFGVASAAFWWGRSAAVLFRTFHRVVPREVLFYLLLFADDGLLMAAGPHYHRVIVALFMYLEVMEVPLSWKKTRGGFKIEWIGYTIDLEGWRIGVSEKKVQWVLSWALRIMEESHILGREFKAGVGRLGFLAGVLVGARPFLAPLYAVSSRASGSALVELYLAVKLSVQFFAQWIEKTPVRDFRPPPSVAGEVFRIDAAADQEGIVVGGWEVFGGRRPKEARWFSVKADRKSCPWLYLKGEPFRSIAAAELLAVTVAVKVFGEGAEWKGGEGRFSISGFTDNSSNSYVVDKFLSTKFPVSMVLMELAYQLTQLNATLNLHWIPREQNEEADDLTKGRYEKFNEELRIPVDLEKIGFEVIPALAECAGKLDEEIRMKKVSKEGKGAGRRTPVEEKLRMTQPW